MYTVHQNMSKTFAQKVHGFVLVSIKYNSSKISQMLIEQETKTKEKYLIIILFTLCSHVQKKGYTVVFCSSRIEIQMSSVKLHTKVFPI